MKKNLLFIVALLLFVVSCSPVTITKSITEYSYDGDKLVQEYQETVVQTPEKRLPMTLRHPELYE